jgi:hypothetical protein
MTRLITTLTAALCLSFLVAACPASECETDEHQCEGMDEIRTCEDGAWSEPEACPTGEECMTMDSGLTHCMATM